MRRYLTIGAVAVLLVGIGVAAYFYFFAKGPGIITTPEFPVAGEEEIETGSGGSTSPSAPGTPTLVSSRLVRISDGPVVPGVSIINKIGSASTSAETVVTYIERQSGNVFSYNSASKISTRTSNKTIPRIQSAVWLPDGSRAFVRYLSGDDFSTINTYALPANGSEGFFLPQNLSDIAVSSTSVLTLVSGVNGSAASLSRTDGSRSSSAFTTPLSALRISFAGKSSYLAYTKPAADLLGVAFIVDNAGRFSRVAGPRSGLAALASPSGKYVLVSYSSGSAMQMELVDVSTGEELRLPVATLAEKCAWAADDSVIYCGVPVSPPFNATYPDDWYQGAVGFSDRIWKIEVSGRYAQLVLDFSIETDEALDAAALATDMGGTMLVFINKNNGSLWGYSL